MAITAETIKQLRELTSCGVMECKKALEEAGGDFNKAKEVLKQRGLEIAAKKSTREVKDGRIEIYIHPGNKLGVLLEVDCETDFVAKNDDFIQFTKDVAMHIAAMAPKYVSSEEISEEELNEQDNKEEYIKEVSLLDQAFVKNPSATIKQMLTDLIAKTGENICINRFSRYKING
jgi:elongation factor Ts